MVMLGLILALPVYAAGPVVDTAVDENDGSCAGDCPLRDAIATANSGDTITFAGDLSIYLDSELSINKTVTIDGGSQDITISGDSGNDGSRDVRVFDITSSGVVTLTNLNIVSGTANQGGGIFNDGTATINNSTLSNNQADFGGGIRNQDGTMTINNSTFSNNQANTFGGGILNFGTLTLNNSTFSDNQANSFGGGIFNLGYAGAATIDNSTISNNQANNVGGGIFNSGTLTLNNSTLSDNQANSGGGISNHEMGVLHLHNTIIANSAGGGDCFNDSGTIATNAYNLIEDNSCSPALSGNPFLGPLQNNGGSTFTRGLLLGSPAIDAGDNTTCLATDQRGINRPRDGDGDSTATCDIGAYELSLVNQAPYIPSNPIPADTSTDIPTNETLSWQGGDPDGDVVIYTVAFGTNDSPPFVGTTVQTSYTPALITGTTYYWVITATDGISESVGELWSFVTSATASSDTDSVYLPIVLK
jgi:CSLREA domain-containing protein